MAKKVESINNFECNTLICDSVNLLTVLDDNPFSINWSAFILVLIYNFGFKF